MTNAEDMMFRLLIKLDPAAAKRQADKIRQDYAPILGVHSYDADRVDALARNDSGVFGIAERSEAEAKDSEFTSAEVVD